MASVSQAPVRGQTTEYAPLPSGTVLKARLDEGLNSERARPGQRFTATLQPREDRSGLPEGAQVVGVVREARAATKSQPGLLDVDFTEIQLPNGRVYPITGSLTGLDSDSVSRTADGRLVSKRTNRNDRMTFIGYGAGAGALIALLTRGDLLTNALLGAAGGYLYERLRKDRQSGSYSNVNLKEGAEFGVRLDQQFAYLPASNPRLDRVPREREELSSPNRDEDAARARRDRLSDRSRVPATAPGSTKIDVLLDDRPVTFGTARPMRAGSGVMVPVVPVLRAAGARYFYNPLTREISVTTHEGTVRGTVGSDVAQVNNERVRLAEPVQNVEGVLYVPERFLELATGMRVSWDDRTSTLRLTRPSGEPDRSLSPGL